MQKQQQQQNTYLKHNVAQKISRVRSELAWFANARTTRSETGRNLPGEQVERQIPWRDETRHTDRHLVGVGEGVGVRQLGGLVLVGEQSRGKETKVVGSARYL